MKYTGSYSRKAYRCGGFDSKISTLISRSTMLSLNENKRVEHIEINLVDTLIFSSKNFKEILCLFCGQDLKGQRHLI